MSTDKDFRDKQLEKKRSWAIKNRERTRKYNRDRRRKLRADTISKMAELGLGVNDSGKPICSNCGCHVTSALTIGHVNDDGAEHRRELGSRSNGSYNTFMWILESSREDILSKDIRLECIYCNLMKKFNGEYPSGDEIPIWK